MPESTTRPPAARWRCSATRNSCSSRRPDRPMPARPIGLSSMTVGDIRLTLFPDSRRVLIDIGFGAGLERGDLILQLAGTPVLDIRDLSMLIRGPLRPALTRRGRRAHLPEDVGGHEVVLGRRVGLDELDHLRDDLG